MTKNTAQTEANARTHASARDGAETRAREDQRRRVLSRARDPAVNLPRRARIGLWLCDDGAAWVAGNVSAAYQVACAEKADALPNTLTPIELLDRLRDAVAGVPLEVRAPDTPQGRETLARVATLLGATGGT